MSPIVSFCPNYKPQYNHHHELEQVLELGHIIKTNNEEKQERAQLSTDLYSAPEDVFYALSLS